MFKGEFLKGLMCKGILVFGNGDVYNYLIIVLKLLPVSYVSSVP